MALTATATKAQRQAITSSLGMKKEFYVTVPPDKPNIKYHVAPFETLDTTFRPIADQLLTLGIFTPHCLIFCQKLYCIDFFQHVWALSLLSHQDQKINVGKGLLICIIAVQKQT